MIRIVCVGKLKEKYWRDAVFEYIKRIQKYTKIEIIEVADESIEDSVVAPRYEMEKIERFIHPKDYLITLEIEGKTFDSLNFSKELDHIQTHYSNITFLIGGSYGLDDSLKKRSNLSLSFSKMTFPHQLFRVLLLEQIYRAYKIKNHETYHK